MKRRPDEPNEWATVLKSVRLVWEPCPGMLVDADDGELAVKGGTVVEVSGATVILEVPGVRGRFHFNRSQVKPAEKE